MTAGHVRPDRTTRRMLLGAGAGAVLAAAPWPRVARSSGAADTLLVGAAAVTVPKLLDLPPFMPTAAQGLVAAAKALIAAGA